MAILFGDDMKCAKIAVLRRMGSIPFTLTSRANPNPVLKVYGAP